MRVTEQEQDANNPQFLHWHKLVVAEKGFSMLSYYARRKHGLSKEVVDEFADLVNGCNEAASLHPNAPISALPRRYFREIEEPDIPRHIQDFKNDVRQFIGVNRHTIKAKQVLIDLNVSSSPVAKRHLHAIVELLGELPDAACIEEVVIFR